MTVETPKCARCRQALPQGSGFCVSCGHNNDLTLIQKSLKASNQAENRISWARRISAWLWSGRS